MSKVQRRFHYDRDIFVPVDAADQQSWCGLAIDRVRLPANERARI
jgi:hypothetical protein